MEYILIYHFSFLSTKNITTLLYIVNGDYMRKKFRSKKRLKHKHVLSFIILTSTLFSLNYLEDNFEISLPNKGIIDKVFKSGNEYSYKGIDNTYLSQEVYEYLKKNIFNSPTNMLKNELNYEIQKKEVVSFSYVENKLPLVYIYNSHQGETYSTEYLEDYNIVPDVLMASNMLKEKLENIGIPTIVENSNILAYMKENNLNHAGSYIASRHFLSMTMKKYPNLSLYIDLHRDSATKEVSTTTINGKKYAKVLFVIGLEYSTYENNLSIVTDINNKIKDKYPNLTRGIMKKQGYGVNGVYNQDLASNVILIEVGGNENNIEEVNNTLDLISQILGEYINEKK